jgi:hypothetical protein
MKTPAFGSCYQIKLLKLLEMLTPENGEVTRRRNAKIENTMSV